LDHALSDQSLRASMREKGLRQAAKFRWDIAARQTAEIYSNAVHGDARLKAEL
jgi:glycosyltransferase involved in cell wall biosynthesis